MSVPRILYLSPCWPHDRAFGGQLRALHIGRALKRIGDVTLAVIDSDPADPEVVRKTSAEFRLEAPIGISLQRNHGITQRLRWALDPHFLNLHGCVAHPVDRARLLSQFQDFDMIWVLNCRTPNIFNLWRWPKSVLDLDDVPSTFQRSVWRHGTRLKEKLKAGVRMRLFQRRERLFKQRFTTLAVCSEADRRYLGGGDRIHVIPNGFERPGQEPPRAPADPPRVGFIGLYSYQPNWEGVQWFLRECWPRIRRELPNVRLRLAGKDTDGPLRPSGQGIDAMGWVPDPAAEIASWSAMIVPVRQGAGTRVKIADAFSRKCPVISTSLGAFGYEVEHGRELLLADDPDAFAKACLSVIRDRANAVAMAERAFNSFLEKWTWEAIAPRVHTAAEDVLGRASSRLTQA